MVYRVGWHWQHITVDNTISPNPNSVEFRVRGGEHVVDLVEDRPLGEVEGAVVTLPGRRQASASPSDLQSNQHNRILIFV